jgi:hypothetical protein
MGKQRVDLKGNLAINNEPVVDFLADFLAKPGVAAPVVCPAAQFTFLVDKLAVEMGNALPVFTSRRLINR